MQQLDKLDRQLLYWLDRNSRESFRELAKKTGAAPERIRYRLQRLVDNGVIFKFQTVFDLARLGYSIYKVYLKLAGADEQQVQRIIRELREDSAVNWLVRFDGMYDIGLAVRVTTIDDLSNFLDRFIDRHNQVISKRRIEVNMLSQYLSRVYFTGKKSRSKKVGWYAAVGKPYELDTLDKQILKLIGENSRISAAEMSQRILADTTVNFPASRETVSRRLRRLEDAKVITGHHIVLNHRAINQLHYKLLLYLNNVSGKDTEALLETCRRLPRVVYIIKTLGDWDYELDLEVQSVEEYRHIVAVLTKAHKNLIKDYSSILVAQIHKYSLITEL